LKVIETKNKNKGDFMTTTTMGHTRNSNRAGNRGLYWAVAIAILVLLASAMAMQAVRKTSNIAEAANEQTQQTLEIENPEVYKGLNINKLNEPTYFPKRNKVFRHPGPMNSPDSSSNPANGR
jgi:hypothetical protein